VNDLVAISLDRVRSLAERAIRFLFKELRELVEPDSNGFVITIFFGCKLAPGLFHFLFSCLGLVEGAFEIAV